MDMDSARRWLIISSLSITGLQVLFLIICPSLDYPINYPKNIDILQMITPVFLGYLGAATHFIFQNQVPHVPVQHQFLGPLVKGPIIIYATGVAGAFFAFGYSNRESAPIGTGMSVDNLSMSLSVLLGILSITTGVITSYLFVAPNKINDKIDNDH